MSTLFTRPTCIVPPSYTWGSGRFGDIADTRRRVYTTYYVRAELRTLLLPIVGEGRPLGRFLDQVQDEIENPAFRIDGRRYEEIAAYLWRRSRASFPGEIRAWERDLDRRAVGDAARLLDAHGYRLTSERLRRPEDARQAVLTTCWTSLPEARPETGTDRATLQAALDREGSPDGINVPIDFSDRLTELVFQRPCRLVVLPGDLSTLAADLMLFGQSLLTRWLTLLAGTDPSDRDWALRRLPNQLRVKVTFLVNSQVTPRNNNLLRLLNPTARNVHELLALPAFSCLRAFQAAGLFQLRTFRSRFPGTVLTDLDEAASAALREADCVVATGEPNNLTLNGLELPCFRIAPIRDFSHVFFTGVKYDRESFRFPRFSILFAPPGVWPAIGWEPDKHQRLTARQFQQLLRALSEDARKDVLDRARGGGDVVTIALNSQGLAPEERGQAAEIRGPGRSERRRRASAFLGQHGGVYTRLRQRVNHFRRRVVHIIHYPVGSTDRRTRLRLGVRFASSLSNHEGRPKSLLTFDDLKAAESNAVFGFNFLYFITRNLVDYFNRSNPHFTLSPWFFGQAIDLLSARVNGVDVLHPPLFNKGALAVMPDGSVRFGRVRLPNSGSVTVPIGSLAGRTRRLDWTAVNPTHLNPDVGIAIFTPMAEHCRELDRQAPHVGGETRSMYFTSQADDRYNFVMINDRLLGIVQGRTEIPPFGTVLSVPCECFDSEERALLEAEVVPSQPRPGQDQARRLVDGRTRVEWNFALDPHWAGAEWIMGGALLMVDDGRHVELDPVVVGAEPSIYQVEGWSLESSQRTQETPVETNLQEARATIGLTSDDQVFLAIIEGRANNRLGATHAETVACLEAYFHERGTRIRYALDLDSASSVSLGLRIDGHFWLLNQTARGSDSKLGDTRFFNHLAFLQETAGDGDVCDS